jgi:hypothetical protein
MSDRAQKTTELKLLQPDAPPVSTELVQRWREAGASPRLAERLAALEQTITGTVSDTQQRGRATRS